MNRILYCFLIITFSLVIPAAASAQDAAGFHATSKNHLSQGRMDSAAYYLEKALGLSPGNLEMLEDQVYLEYLRRDFAKALTIANTIASRPDASVKTYQLVGMVHEEIADYKEARKTYEKGLNRFPNSGMLYTKLGELLSTMKKRAEAIRTWEMGIEMDPGHSGNYYHAALYHAANNDPLWAMLYAENFVNIESLSERTTEIKALLASIYKKISAPGYLPVGDNPFGASIVGIFHRQPPLPANNLSVEALTALRLAFINDWQRDHAARFPYKLFEYHQQLVKEGMFDAYNQWLFGTAVNPAAYTAWMDANKEKMSAFRHFTGGRLYKVPTGQYYRSK